MTEDAAEALVERVQVLTEQLEGIEDAGARAVADDLVASVMQLYGTGLERIFDALAQPGASAADVRAVLVDDGVVASLLLIHDLYPVDLDTRVREALASVRPYMESHGGDVELLSLEDGVAKLKLVGSCNGCSASSATLELAIKGALEEMAPDLAGIVVEGLDDDPKPTTGFALPVIQSGSGSDASNGGGTPLPMANGGKNGAPPQWEDLDGIGGLQAGSLTALSVSGNELLLANVGGTLLAYRNSCGFCSERLDAATMTPGGTLTCPACEKNFNLRKAGRSPDDDKLQMRPVPLLRGDGRVRVALTT